MKKKKYEIPTMTSVRVRIGNLLETVSQADKPNTPVGSRGKSTWDDEN